MKHTKAVSRRPARAQSSYASKLLFKQEASTIITDAIVGTADGILTLASANFINSLGLGTIIDIIIGGSSS